MLGEIRSRLSYANVMATVAIFLALGGGAYAVTGVPDRGGVFHGCVNNKTGVLRVVKPASSCHKAVRHGGHRNPGESAIAWNQQGRPGLNGTSGTNGINGINGTNGSDGKNGANGATQVTVRTAVGTVANPMEQSTALAECNTGERVTGGGASVGTSNGSLYELDDSGPDGGGWLARARNTGNAGETATVTAFVICASP